MAYRTAISLASSIMMSATGAVTAHRPESLVLNIRRVRALESMHCSRCCKHMLYNLPGVSVAAEQQVQLCVAYIESCTPARWLCTV